MADKLTQQIKPVYLSLKSAAVYSGLSVVTLRKLIARGELTPVRPRGLRKILVKTAELEGLLETVEV